MVGWFVQVSAGSPGCIRDHGSGHAMTTGSDVGSVGLGVGSGGPDEGNDSGCNRGRERVVNNQVCCDR